MEQGRVRAVEGDLEAAWALSVSDEEIENGTATGWAGYLVGFRGWMRLWRGAWEEAVDDFRRQRTLTPQECMFSPIEIGQELTANAFLKRKTEAQRLLEEARPLLPEAGALNICGSWELGFAVVESCALLGRCDEAAALYPALREVSRQGMVTRFWLYGLVETQLGVSAACGEDYEAADEHFAASLRLAEDLPLVTERAEARRWWAWALLRRAGDGDRDRGGSSWEKRPRSTSSSGVCVTPS